MNVLKLELSLEQQFSLRKYEKQVAELSQEQAQKFLLDVLHQLMVKDNAIRSLLKSALGIDPCCEEIQRNRFSHGKKGIYSSHELS
jgi:Phycobilisome degradation protein nblA